MKEKKKIYIILGIIVFVAIAFLLLYFLVFKKNDNTNTVNDKCDNITGGGYNLIFKSDDEILGNMHVCIACPPNSYEDLLIPTKEGNTFLGWFYDESFKSIVNASNSIEITPISKKNANGCIIGYEDITLYAKWTNEENKLINVSFDSNGGNKINDIVLNCDNNTVIISKLPIPKRDGYDFVAWKDSHEIAILEAAELSCDGDLKLKASWNKKNS